ncbi:Adenine DNA glycosylase [Pseudoclavibacter triregionum]|nr:Adenine DNA glycosylase [Pseudoclavibacter triregionum]
MSEAAPGAGAGTDDGAVFDAGAEVEPPAERERRLELVRRVGAWFAEEARDLPWRRPGTTPWGVLVSEVMSQQTQVARVAPRWEAFLERWPDAATFAAASDADAIRAWERLGYPRRALRLRACAEAIVERHGGEVPASVEALLALPGIGPYTAGAVAAFAFGIPAAVVDTNVRRVLARAIEGRADASAPSPRRDAVAWSRALDGAVRAEAVAFAQGAMELGAVACTARSPRCEACPIADACAWLAAGRPPLEEGAAPPRRAQPRFAGSLREMRGRLLAELRAHGAVPRAELEGRHGEDERYAKALDSLLADGLAVDEGDGGIALPGEGRPGGP